MTRLIRTEIRKLLTTKLWWGLLITAVVTTGLFVWGTLSSVGNEGNPFQSLNDPNTQRGIISMSGQAGIFILILGIIGITTEFRHFTSRPTFLIEPRRWRVVAAKFATYGGLGLVYAIACTIVVAAIMVPWMSSHNADFSLTGAGIPKAFVLTTLSVAIYGMVGVGIGVLIRNQIAAVIGGLAYFLLIENIISIIPVVKEIYKYLPGPSGQAMVDVTTGDTELLAPLAGGLLFVAWGLFFTILGATFTVRRDVP